MFEVGASVICTVVSGTAGVRSVESPASRRASPSDCAQLSSSQCWGLFSDASNGEYMPSRQLAALNKSFQIRILLHDWLAWILCMQRPSRVRIDGGGGAAIDDEALTPTPKWSNASSSRCYLSAAAASANAATRLLVPMINVDSRLLANPKAYHQQQNGYTMVGDGGGSAYTNIAASDMHLEKCRKRSRAKKPTLNTSCFHAVSFFAASFRRRRAYKVSECGGILDEATTPLRTAVDQQPPPPPHYLRFRCPSNDLHASSPDINAASPLLSTPVRCFDIKICILHIAQCRLC